MSRPTIGEGIHHYDSKKRACPNEVCCFCFPMKIKLGIVGRRKKKREDARLKKAGRRQGWCLSFKALLLSSQKGSKRLILTITLEAMIAVCSTSST